MGYGNDYYGKLNNGQMGWNTDLSAFVPGGVTDANMGGLVDSRFFDGVGGVSSNAGSSVNGIAGGQGIGGALSNLGITNTTTAGANGAQQTSQGWGGLALGLGQMYMNYTQGKEQQKFAREQLDFSKEQFYKNYAMQMDKYRRRVNRGNAGLAYANSGHNGSWSNTMSKYNDGSAMIDEDGVVMADPKYGAVKAGAPVVQSAFAPQQPEPAYNAADAMAPVATGINPVATSAFYNPPGTGTESVLTDEASRVKARGAGERTSTTEADDKRKADVEKSMSSKTKEAKETKKKITG